MTVASSLVLNRGQRFPLWIGHSTLRTCVFQGVVQDGPVPADGGAGEPEFVCPFFDEGPILVIPVSGTVAYSFGQDHGRGRLGAGQRLARQPGHRPAVCTTRMLVTV